MKYKIFIIIGILTLSMLCYGITYSIFHSNSNLDSDKQNIAKFIFNADSLDQFQLLLNDLKPGDNQEYPFSVSNNNPEKRSDVSVEYQISIKTFHFVPLVIELYKLNGETEELIMTCNETYTRNAQNELICESSIQEMSHVSSKLDNYKLKVEFPIEFNDEVYSDLVDYLNIEIKSWQKIKD